MKLFVRISEQHRRTCIATTHLSFFFQAEDGIRDYKVTGVQTCALPISGSTSTEGALGVHSAPTDLSVAVGMAYHLSAPLIKDRPESERSPGSRSDHPHYQIGRASCRERV